jgi:phosphonate transport system substrate-binding protein
MIAVLLAALPACVEALPIPPTPEPAASRLEAEQVTPLPPGMTRLRVAVTPYIDPSEVLRTRTLLHDWLSRRFGVPVEAVVASTYDGMSDLLAQDAADLYVFSPYALVRAGQRGLPAEPLVAAVSEGSVSSAGYIVVRADGPLHSLDDLRGRRFAYVDPASTSGYLLATRLLRSRGLDPSRDFVMADFLGNHEAVLMAVLDRSHDAGAVYQGAIAQLERHRGIDPHTFRIVGKTERMPHDLYSVRADAPEQLKGALRQALLSLSVLTDEGRVALSPMRVNGFVAPDNDALAALRAASETLEP